MLGGKLPLNPATEERREKWGKASSAVWVELGDAEFLLSGLAFAGNKARWGLGWIRAGVGAGDEKEREEDKREMKISIFNERNEKSEQAKR